MARYYVEYLRPGEPPVMHELEAASEPQARIRFLNLSWVAFTGIVIKSVGVASDQPEAAKERARKAGAKGVRSHAYVSPTGSGNCRLAASEARLWRKMKAHAIERALGI